MTCCRGLTSEIVFLMIIMASLCSAGPRSGPTVRVVGGHRWAFPLVRKMLLAFSRERDVPKRRFAVEKWSDWKVAERFEKAEGDLLVHYGLAEVSGAATGEKTCERYVVGQARAAVITSERSRVSSMTTRQVRDALRGATRAEQRGPAERMIYCGEPKWRSVSSHVIRRSCMLVADDYSGPFYTFRADMVVCPSPETIVRKVARNSRAIGTLLWEGDRLHGVKAVPIAETADGPFVAPSTEPIIQEDYPLSEYVVLYVKPDAPELAREFCEFAVGKEGSEIATEAGLFTPYRQRQYEEKKRLRKARLGRGERVTAAAVGGGRSLMQDLSTEYVRAKEAIRLSCVPCPTERYAMRGFLGVSILSGKGRGGKARDLLLLEDRPSAEAIREYGKKWNELRPTEHLVAGRAVAIVVNRANKLKSLTLGQVRAIFSGQVSDWQIVGGTGLSAQEGAGGVPIKRFGLSPGDPAAGIFYEECLGRSKLRNVRYKKSSAEAVAAVSMDAGGIAFVDMAEVSGDTDGVKVLPLRLGAGEQARVVRPTAQNIRNAMYPLSERLRLYVHPEAGEAAKGFARFVATCGASEETIYTDVVGEVREVYRKHGLIRK